MKLKLFVGTLFVISGIALAGIAFQSYKLAPLEQENTASEASLKGEVLEVTNGITRPVLIAIFLLSLFGVGETAYVMRTRLTALPAACPIGNHTSCSTVLKSEYNTFLGVHNDLLGFLYYVTVTLLSLFLNLNLGPASWLKLVLVAVVAGGVCMSLYLTYVQARILRAWCFWCLTSAFTTWFLAAFIIQRELFS